MKTHFTIQYSKSWLFTLCHALTTNPVKEETTKSSKNPRGGVTRGVVTDTVLREFKLQSRDYFHFRINTHVNG